MHTCCRDNYAHKSQVTPTSISKYPPWYLSVAFFALLLAGWPHAAVGRTA